MTEYATYTVTDLSAFSGRPVGAYPAYAVETALLQATLLFKISTCLPVLPVEQDDQDMVRLAILAYADMIILTMPYAELKANPFNSESLGSYSYSKTPPGSGRGSFSASAAVASRGEKSGVMWFDLAVERLGVCWEEDGIPDFGGLETFEFDEARTAGQIGANLRLLGPADLLLIWGFGFASGDTSTDDVQG